MTEMVYGSVFRRNGEPIFPRWWRTVDKWSIGCVLALFGIGLLLGLASSPPLAERNGLWAFHYFERQVAFGAISLLAMFTITLLAPQTVRRIAVLLFLASFGAMVMLPFVGTDFGKGAVRWFSLGFGSLQPSEFLKPGFVVLVAWLIAASNEVAGPPGKFLSFALALAVVGLLAMQPDYGQACLIFFAW
ncbi:MAG: cell division protein FtsW, partial [Boseongicola sp. SB0664_bin_43]|nr:cell division protein FtsW [Boseongicola sp. SB0664_bin_43]